MKYDPIEIKVDKHGVDFFFVRKYGKQWFYQVHSLYAEKNKQWWDEHLQEKMWYTPELRAKVLSAMDYYLKMYPAKSSN